jgi:hypothetical protein
MINKQEQIRQTFSDKEKTHKSKPHLDIVIWQIL